MTAKYSDTKRAGQGLAPPHCSGEAIVTTEKGAARIHREKSGEATPPHSSPAETDGQRGIPAPPVAPAAGSGSGRESERPLVAAGRLHRPRAGGWGSVPAKRPPSRGKGLPASRPQPGRCGEARSCPRRAGERRAGAARQVSGVTGPGSVGNGTRTGRGAAERVTAAIPWETGTR